MWLALFFILLGVIFYIKFIKPLYYWDEKKVPNVKGWPIIGKQGKVILNKITPSQWLREMYLEFPDRRYSGSSQFNRPALIVRDPALIKDLTIKNFDNFPNRINIVPKDVDPIMGNSLIFLRDHEWKSMRSNLSPAFTLNKMKTMFELILETSHRFCSYHKTGASSEVVAVDMGDACARFANDVIATCAFDINCNSLKDKNNEFYTMGKIVSNFALGRVLKVLLYTYLKPIFKVVNWGFFSNKVNNFFMNIILDKITWRRRNGNKREDMIYLLMEAQKGKLKHDEEGPNTHAGFATVDEEDKKVIKRKITDQDIVSQCLTFFFGGVTTVTNPLCLLSYELAINPEIQEKLRDEIDTNFDKCDGKFSYHDIFGMKYLDMVVSEAIRKWPPVHVLRRECNKDFILKAETPQESDFVVETGTGLIIPIIGIHYDEKYYSDPYKFDPERFNEENRKKILPYTYLPFGSGPRNCIASRFALLELKTFFVSLLSNFEIVPVENTKLPTTLYETSTGECWIGLKARTRTL